MRSQQSSFIRSERTSAGTTYDEDGEGAMAATSGNELTYAGMNTVLCCEYSEVFHTCKSKDTPRLPLLAELKREGRNTRKHNY